MSYVSKDCLFLLFWTLFGGWVRSIVTANRNLVLPLMGDLDVSPHPPDPFVERWKGALSNFGVDIHGITCTIVGHALANVRSLYQAVSLEVIDGGFAKETEDAKVE